MYFHPLLLTEAQRQQGLVAYREFTRFWLDSAERHYRLHTHAVSRFHVVQQDNLRALSEAIDITHFFVRWSARAVPASLLMLHAATRPAEWAADIRRDSMRKGAIPSATPRTSSRRSAAKSTANGATSHGIGPGNPGDARNRQTRL